MTNPFNLKNMLICLLLLLLTLGITYPKFSKSSGLEQMHPSYSVVSDDDEYMAYVNFFRHIPHQALPNAPFSYRPLTPYLASFLPFDPGTSINIINITALYLTTILILALARMYFNGFIPLACALLFLISFPSFYYCADARVDTLALFILALLLKFTLTRRDILFGLCFIIGLFAKETIVISLVPFFVYNVQSRRKAMSITLIVLLVFFILEQSWVRMHLLSHQVYFWKPNFDVFFENLSRPRALLSFILSLGLPGLFSLIFWFKLDESIATQSRVLCYKTTGLLRLRLAKAVALIKEDTLFALYSGFLSSIALFLFAFFSAYADGRFIWTSYPYVCLISGFYLQKVRGFP